MKLLIKKLLREAINLNLSKELSRGWDASKLDDIFGKNIYRLYYDLDSGKQITPTRKEPKLKFDVPKTDRLKNDIINLISGYEYELLDFEKNIALNKKNNQKINLSKILNRLDLDLSKKYAQFLNLNSKDVSSNKKLYAMISRHPHDISTMGTYEKTSSCANISHLNTKKGVERESGGEGVQKILSALEAGSVIIYLIHEGDWNKQEPIARYLLGALCGLEVPPPNSMYGDWNQKFANFIEEWVKSYNINVHGEKELIGDDDVIFNQNINDLLELIESWEPSNFDYLVNKNYSHLLRGLIKYKRYDVLYEYIKQKNSKSINFFTLSSKIYGDTIYKNFPDNVKKLFKKDYSKLYKDLNELYNASIGIIDNKTVIGIYAKEVGIEKAMNMFVTATHLFDKVENFFNNSRYNKLFNPEDYNKLNTLKPKLKKMFTDIGYNTEEL